jgi:hypothetical protein
VSVRSLAALAVERDRAPAGQPALGGAGAAAVRGPNGQGSARDAMPQSFTDVVISAIPTEPLAAYTALVGVVIGAVGLGASGNYLPFRWTAYGAFLAIVVAAVWLAYARAARGVQGRRNRYSFPAGEIFSALVAGGAWGLVMPGSPLDPTLTGTARTLTTTSVLVGTAALLSLLTAPALRTGTSSGTGAGPNPAPKRGAGVPPPANGHDPVPEKR